MQPDAFIARCTSRRSFLKHGGAAAALAAGGHFRADSSRAVGPTEIPRDRHTLSVGVQTYTLRALPLEEAVGVIQALGVRTIELFPQHLAGKNPADVQALLQARGIGALSYGVIPFTRDHEANRKMFEFARSYGMTNLSCDPDPDSLESVDRLTEEYGMTAAIHPHGPGHRWSETEQLACTFARHSDRIGLCVDTGHLIRAGINPLDVLRRFRGRVHAVHLKDFAKTTDSANWTDVPAGEANLDVQGVVDFLHSADRQVLVFIEHEGANAVSVLKRSLKHIRAVADSEARGDMS